jgi:hypothetical protein
MKLEDELASLRILSQGILAEDRAVASAQHFLDLATTRYQLGLGPYLAERYSCTIAAQHEPGYYFERTLAVGSKRSWD